MANHRNIGFFKWIFKGDWLRTTIDNNFLEVMVDIS